MKVVVLRCQGFPVRLESNLTWQGDALKQAAIKWSLRLPMPVGGIDAFHTAMHAPSGMGVAGASGCEETGAGYQWVDAEGSAIIGS